MNNSLKLTKRQTEILDKLQNHNGVIRGSAISNSWTLVWDDGNFRPTQKCRLESVRKLIDAGVADRHHLGGDSYEVTAKGD